MFKNEISLYNINGNLQAPSLLKKNETTHFLYKK